VNSVLKVCGQHVKQLFFPTWCQRHNYWVHWYNTVSLSLPATTLNPELLEGIFASLKHILTLDIQWDRHMKQLLEAINQSCISLKELTIRETFSIYASFDQAESIELWFDYWMKTGFIPRKINVVYGVHYTVIDFCWRSLADQCLNQHAVMVYWSFMTLLKCQWILSLFSLSFK